MLKKIDFIVLDHYESFVEYNMYVSVYDVTTDRLHMIRTITRFLFFVSVCKCVGLGLDMNQILLTTNEVDDIPIEDIECVMKKQILKCDDV